jgi:hypothetical protein
MELAMEKSKIFGNKKPVYIFIKIATHRSVMPKALLNKTALVYASQGFARCPHYFDKSLSKLLRTVLLCRRHCVQRTLRRSH